MAGRVDALLRLLEAGPPFEAHVYDWRAELAEARKHPPIDNVRKSFGEEKLVIINRAIALLAEYRDDAAASADAKRADLLEAKIRQFLGAKRVILDYRQSKELKVQVTEQWQKRIDELEAEHAEREARPNAGRAEQWVDSMPVPGGSSNSVLSEQEFWALWAAEPTAMFEESFGATVKRCLEQANLRVRGGPKRKREEVYLHMDNLVLLEGMSHEDAAAKARQRFSTRGFAGERQAGQEL
jgi:hypothetical protein